MPWTVADRLAAPAAVLPAPHLVVPAGTDLFAAARAWYDGARWLLSPDDAHAAALPVVATGARFRGARTETPLVVARLELAAGVVVDGPLTPGGPAAAVAVAHAGLRPDVDTYRLPDDPTAAAWATAAARHVGGVVVIGGQVLVPRPHDALVRLTAYAPNPAGLADVASLLRTALPSARPVRTTAATTDAADALRHDLDYDGAVVVRTGEADAVMPPALRAVDWRRVGPHTCTVTWLSPNPDDDPGSLDLMSLRRAAPWLVRAARALRDGLGGTLLDADGFVADDATLGALAAAR
ncbi:hypothetical protein GCM10025864_39860 [Luteimicrobium album]|uniref:Uncharacterized protein n=2 Tax=Luteimicrobium album TaxID=1054550 RepID=A0ABQ6I712_9MICO|nr:hypothetical protein GCM10025864_39860 [Luteimicrobium album]